MPFLSRYVNIDQRIAEGLWFQWRIFLGALPMPWCLPDLPLEKTGSALTAWILPDTTGPWNPPGITAISSVPVTPGHRFDSICSNRCLTLTRSAVSPGGHVVIIQTLFKWSASYALTLDFVQNPVTCQGYQSNFYKHVLVFLKKKAQKFLALVFPGSRERDRRYIRPKYRVPALTGDAINNVGLGSGETSGNVFQMFVLIFAWFIISGIFLFVESFNSQGGVWLRANLQKIPWVVMSPKPIYQTHIFYSLYRLYKMTLNL